MDGCLGLKSSKHTVCIGSFGWIWYPLKYIPYKQKEVLEWATKIAERYVGKKMPRLMGR